MRTSVSDSAASGRPYQPADARSDFERPDVSESMPGPPPTATDRPPLDEYYNSLFTAFGPQHWWPGKTQFEVIVGAILTQNTSWTNVARAIENLRAEGLLSPAAIER